MSGFGADDPRQMPPHLFSGALKLRYETAVQAETTGQNCSICPRYWYVDALFRCQRCGAEFEFSAAEQRVWYEDYGFWVDSLPKHCSACRQALRTLKTVRQEYDGTVEHTLRHEDLQSKKRLAAVIDQLYELGGDLPPRINHNRRRLARQIARAEEGRA
jgi:hypothetical protein